MKYSLPQINFSLLRKAEEFFNKGVAIFKERTLKTESDLLESIFGTLCSFFSTIGRPVLSRKMRVKEDSPRPAPLSAKYNKFVDALETDLTGLYGDQTTVDGLVTTHYNYAQSNRDTLDNLRKDVAERLTDFGVMSQTVDSRDIWYKESFNNSEGVDGKLSTGSIDASRGIYTVRWGEGEDIFVPGNIGDIVEDIAYDKREFFNSQSFPGREYGIISDADEDVMSDETPRLNVTDPTLPWTSRSIAAVVDPDGGDTSWEVEITARRDMSGHNTATSSEGPCYFLRDAGEKGTVSKDGRRGIMYKYDKGHLVYHAGSYGSSFFYGQTQAKKHLFSVSLDIILIVPKRIHSITIARKLEPVITEVGSPHTIYVTDIRTTDGNAPLEAIPAFAQSPLRKTSDRSVTTRAGVGNVERSQRSASGRTVTRSGTVAPQQTPSAVTTMGGIRSGAAVVTGSTLAYPEEPSSNKPARLRRGISNMRLYDPNSTTRAASEGSTAANIRRGSATDSNIYMTPSSSSFSTDDSWTFPTRLVKTVRITLATDAPYKIRYTMGRYGVVHDPLIGHKTKMWTFVQYSAKDLAMESVDMEVGVDLRNRGGWWSAMAAFPLVAFWNPLAIFSAALAFLANLFGTSVKYDSFPHALHTLADRARSDLYRWSIGISDISATSKLYEDSSVMVSKTYVSPEPIDRIVLYSNHELSGGSVEYYIIAADEQQSVRIQPWEELDVRYTGTNRYIPKMLYVNSEMPEDRRAKTRWGSAAYIDTASPLHMFRVKAVLVRGADVESTPFIEDYKVRVIPKKIGGSLAHVNK